MITSGSSYHPVEVMHEGTIQAALSMLHARRSVRIPRWACEECGMIHMGARPAACDSCGHKQLAQQADPHWEMNARW